jgi:hypothetical protein
MLLAGIRMLNIFCLAIIGLFYVLQEVYLLACELLRRQKSMSSVSA